MRRAATRSNRYFSFLRHLRSAGRNNMYGAVPYLMDAFGLDRNEAFRIICEFVDTVDAGEPPRGARPAMVSLAGDREPTLFDVIASPEPDSDDQ